VVGGLPAIAISRVRGRLLGVPSLPASARQIVRVVRANEHVVSCIATRTLCALDDRDDLSSHSSSAVRGTERREGMSINQVVNGRVSHVQGHLDGAAVECTGPRPFPGGKVGALLASVLA
jgi:hypothetical protein